MYLNQIITGNTTIEVTEARNGRTQVYEQTAKRWINAVYDDGQNWEEIDEEYPNFFELPVTEQLDICCERNNERYAARTTYKIVE